MIDPIARTVRLRHEPKGFFYELRGDETAVEVFRVDQLRESKELCGNLHFVKGRWRATKSEDKRKMDALLLVARAWNYVPLLKPSSAPPSGPRAIEGDDAAASTELDTGGTPSSARPAGGVSW